MLKNIWQQGNYTYNQGLKSDFNSNVDNTLDKHVDNLSNRLIFDMLCLSARKQGMKKQ
ncbi:MAG: hypothetical protein WCJ49_01195 [Deltaproteobacteria bacterium]